MSEAKTVYAVDWFRALSGDWPKNAEEVFAWADRQEGISKEHLEEVRQARAQWTWPDQEDFVEDMNNFYWPYGVPITELAPDPGVPQDVTAGPV